MTAKGKFVLTLLFLGVIGFGTWKWWNKLAPQAATPIHHQTTGPGAQRPTDSTTAAAEPAAAVGAPDLAAGITETQTSVPTLPAPGAYQPQNNVVEIELSEYAGYAGLIVANGGLEPSENSLFFKKHGFKVKISLSEEESWPALNTGKLAASATTVDVLAVYGRQFQVVVPAQIGYSRGADGVVVRSGIKRINGLQGKTLATAQFTEAEFFIRYLAQEAGLKINALHSLKDSPDPAALNLIFCTNTFAAGDLFLQDLQSGGNRLAGCVTWAPKTTEVAEASQGKAHVLTTSRNLLVISDILVVNKGFANQHPKLVTGLVKGLLEGNRLLRENPGAHMEVIGKAFGWNKAKIQEELSKVHLSNLPENLAFFSGAIDAAGSFGGIYQSALYAYGSDLIKNPLDGDRFVDLAHLKSLEQAKEFAGEKIAIAPIRSGSGAPLEGDPLLSKDIRFLFAPNSSNLEVTNAENIKNLEALKRLLQVSPGSVILLRGHVDNSMVEKFRQQGGEPFVRQMSLKAVEFSKSRASEIKRLLIEKYKVDISRLDIVGRGWEEPLGTDQEQNRRVEAQWFTLE